MSEFEKFIQVGTEAALAAGRLLVERSRTEFAVSRKGETDLVTEVDLASERLIVSRLLEAFPDHTVLAEEKHSVMRRNSHTWIIDPLDGTTNYVHRYPAFSVSIGLEIDGELQWGIVYNPNLEEVFTARRGEGAFCNQVRLQVSKIGSLRESLLATGFPYDLRDRERNNLDLFNAFMLCTQGVRRTGSAALDLCSVAAGRFDGFWETWLSPWDTAAGHLMVREAGGMVTDFRGRPGSIYDPPCVASNGLIHKQMLEVIHATIP
jgi:myo-inositol-1(or 4)-monophosphatase